MSRMVGGIQWGWDRQRTLLLCSAFSTEWDASFCWGSLTIHFLLIAINQPVAIPPCYFCSCAFVFVCISLTLCFNPDKHNVHNFILKIDQIFLGRFLLMTSFQLDADRSTVAHKNRPDQNDRRVPLATLAAEVLADSHLVFKTPLISMSTENKRPSLCAASLRRSVNLT